MADEGFSVTFNRTPTAEELLDLQICMDGIDGTAYLSAILLDPTQPAERENIVWRMLTKNQQTDWHQDVSTYIEDDIEGPIVTFMNTNGEVRGIRFNNPITDYNQLIGLNVPLCNYTSIVENLMDGQKVAIMFDNLYTVMERNGSIIKSYIAPCEPAQAGGGLELVGHYEGNPHHTFVTETVSCDVRATDVNGLFADIWGQVGRFPITYEFEEQIHYLSSPILLPVCFSEI